MADGCMSQGTAQHETLHTIGISHEHIRSDRDNYIKVKDYALRRDKPKYIHNYRKLDRWRWIDSGHPFDLRSVLNYSGTKYMTTLSGKYWKKNRVRLTSSDALQIQW